MGLLDDAIREHLELKRRAGADPAEVARQEREALGPARRGPEPLEVAPPSAPAAPAPEPEDHEVEPAPAPQAPEPPAPEPDPEPEYVYEPEPEPDPAPRAAEPEPAPRAAEPEPEPEPPAREPEPEPAEEPLWEEPRGSIVDQPTVAFDAADVEEAQRRGAPVEPAEPVERDAPETPPGDEDVLEETPDFLQETPEHDRLWFEQRPPRDFDFDG